MNVCLRGKRCAKVLIICLLLSLILTVWISLQLSPIITSLSVNTSDCECHPNEDNAHHKAKDMSSTETSSHRLAVVVPFRDRFDELLTFVPHMKTFLKKQGIDYKIYIINQMDVYRFNRASLINAGFLISRPECDYMAMHDVDLLPLNANLSYHFPTDGPFHVSSPQLHPKYHYKTFVGGVLLIRGEHFEKVNGMSNNYWGWGLEDDEFYVRLKEANLFISRPQGITTGINDTFRHIHSTHRKRDTIRLFNQKEITRKRDRKTGLNSVQFRLKSVNEVMIDRSAVSVYNVQLICDLSLTPWCQTRQTIASKGPKAANS
ncbi:unnamed protein product [Oppiella nova]|uniref:Beta-1,4-N-acetylgalactosaminyltransferase n=1 Tax=Oppiella nova TaxID=334625 RepID=A0A7R9QMU0_9ACAR|nr:unnamed protein product [Oppiella nova]CAG2168922.1 unnamed protein product [Oppiella nova]